MTPENMLEELKNEYEGFRKKYDLPEFSELNEVFEIEDIDVETEFLLKKIRKKMTEKMVEYLRFIEIILNPSNAPMFFFKLVKKLDGSDKDKLSKIYEKLGNFEIQIISLDLDYSEEGEAEFIKNIFDIFKNEIREELVSLIDKLKNGNESVKRVNGSYFG